MRDPSGAEQRAAESRRSHRYIRLQSSLLDHMKRPLDQNSSVSTGFFIGPGGATTTRTDHRCISTPARGGGGGDTSKALTSGPRNTPNRIPHNYRRQRMSAEEALPFLPEGFLPHARRNMFTLPSKFDAVPADGRRRLKPVARFERASVSPYQNLMTAWVFSAGSQCAGLSLETQVKGNERVRPPLGLHSAR